MTPTSATVFSLRPVGYRLRARFGGAPGTDWPSAAAERRELAPATELPAPAAICLPGEEARATGAMQGATLEHERAVVHARVGRHGPTVVYRFDDALIADGCWYAQGAYEVLRHDRRRPWAIGAAPWIDEAMLCTDSGAQTYFGHWLCDALCSELLADDLSLVPLTLARPPWTHEAGYRAITGLAAVEVGLARVRRLWIVDDKGYNPNRVDRFRRLRARVRAGAVPAGGRVFIDRGASGAARRLVNREAVLARLVGLGFRVIEPEKMTPRQVVDALAGATLAVGVEGSHLNHALLAMPEGGALIAIQPPDRFNMFNKTIGGFANLRFGFVVADPHAEGFELDPDRLERTIALVDAATPRHDQETA